MTRELEISKILNIPYEEAYKIAFEGVKPEIEYFTKKEIKKIKEDDFATKDTFEIFVGAYVEDLSNALKENQELKDELEVKKHEMEEATVVLNDLKSYREDMDKATKRVFEQLSEGENKLIKAEEFKKQDELKLQELTNERNKLLEEKSALQKEIENLTSEISQLQNEKDALLTEQNALSTDIAQIKAERDVAMSELNNVGDLSESQINLIKRISGYEGDLSNIVDAELLPYLHVLTDIPFGYLDQLHQDSEYIDKVWAMCDNSAIDYYLLSRDVNEIFNNLKENFAQAGLEFDADVAIKANNTNDELRNTYNLGKELYEEQQSQVTE